MSKKVGMHIVVTPEQRDMIRDIADREHRSYTTLFLWLVERYKKEIEEAERAAHTTPSK